MNPSIYTFLSAILITIVSMAGACTASHPYHVSYAEVEWNASSGNFEVALCVWPADLEKAIAAQEKKIVDLDNTEGLDSLIEKYVADHFLIRQSVAKGEPKPAAAKIHWVGHEKDLKKAWLYFEIISNKTATNWSLENKIFFELNEDQSNHVQVTLGKNVSNLVCNAATRKHAVSTTTTDDAGTTPSAK